MKTVVVGSKNPVKLGTVKEAFSLVFPTETFEYISYEAKSGVPDQPFGSEETKRGAKNRADDCRSAYGTADYCVGLEGGLEEVEEEFWATAWMCIVDSEGRYGYGKTGAFLLPTEVSQHIHNGKELGDAVDIAFNKINSKHDTGTVGILTKGLVNRKDFYRDSLIFALIPFLHPILYTKTRELMWLGNKNGVQCKHMKQFFGKNEVRSSKHTDIQQEPSRMPSRLEGVARNLGIKSKKKEPKG